MIRSTLVAVAVLAASQSFAAPAPTTSREPTATERFESLLYAQRRGCKAVSSCREAVEMWCGGYSRADADKDGIPCENVCSSKAEVDEIKAEIGC